MSAHFGRAHANSHPLPGESATPWHSTCTPPPLSDELSNAHRGTHESFWICCCLETLSEQFRDLPSVKMKIRTDAISMEMVSIWLRKSTGRSMGKNDTNYDNLIKILNGRGESMLTSIDSHKSVCSFSGACLRLRTGTRILVHIKISPSLLPPSSHLLLSLEKITHR